MYVSFKKKKKKDKQTNCNRCGAVCNKFTWSKILQRRAPQSPVGQGSLPHHMGLSKVKTLSLGPALSFACGFSFLFIYLFCRYGYLKHKDQVFDTSTLIYHGNWIQLLIMPTSLDSILFEVSLYSCNVTII